MFAAICTKLHLGELIAPPVRLTGGYTHRMVRLDTTTGCYAVKLLNPEIMQRPEALDNYRTAENFEMLLEQEKLPILPALTIGGRKLHCVEGQYLYVFDYFDGRVLPPEEITPAHCKKVGAVLARIHAVDRRKVPLRSSDEAGPPEGNALWQRLAEELLSTADACAEGRLLHAAVPMLERVTAAAETAIRRLPCVETLCHNDMDPKNVLWQGMDFRIIDLECLGYANPAQELLDLAVSWSEPADEQRFKAFVSAYCEAGGEQMADAALVYDGRRNYLDWLVYNARRACCDDPEERRIAREQVRITLEKIERDLKKRGTTLRWMEDVLRA